MKERRCLVVDFTKEYTKLFVNKKQIDMNELFDEKNISPEYRKMLIEITLGIRYPADGYEVSMSHPIDLTGGMIRNHNKESFINFSSIKTSDNSNKVRIDTKIANQKYDEAIKLYEMLEENNQFDDYCNILDNIFFKEINLDHGKRLQRIKEKSKHI